jgi:peptidoglycan/LPS O-acetylase OafA/YrhL
MNYRSEIDGLRALAVLPVILFHAGFSAFSGGFVGVDIFFVISGYLITRIILDDIAKGTFSIARFYERRARRILPALFCVIFATIPFALFWMLPSQHEAYSRSMIAVVLFISNLFFWRESGYFAAESAEKPLLHAWSLGVEEQYYVLFPLILLLLWCLFKHRAFYAVAAMALVSLLLCEYASRYYTSANFFILPTRAWELFAGSLCAFVHLHSVPKSHNLLSALGIVLIGYAIFAYGEQMRLPSLYTLAPVLGAVLILLYGTNGTWVARLLSQRLVVGIGLVSYSAYLWHQPIFAFARIHSSMVPDAVTMAGLAGLVLLLSIITWRYIEQPFRHKPHRYYVQNRKALPLALLGALSLLAVGVYGHITHGRLDAWKQNASPNSTRAFELIDHERTRDFAYDNGDCVFNLNVLDASQEERITACSKKYGAGIAVIGDSHAMNLFHVLNAKRGERPFMVGLAQGMCRPYEAIATCNYQPFLDMLKRKHAIFSHVIYEQAGWELLTNAYDKDIAQDEISGLPINAVVPNFATHQDHIGLVTHYLADMTNDVEVTWLGPRIEPQITESTVVRLGCDYPFALRPNQEANFKALDAAIAEQLKNTKIHFRSQIDLMQFDMRKDFMNCDVTYWKDRNHYSTEGEKRFGERITLDAILGAL